MRIGCARSIDSRGWEEPSTNPYKNRPPKRTCPPTPRWGKENSTEEKKINIDAAGLGDRSQPNRLQEETQIICPVGNGACRTAIPSEEADQDGPRRHPAAGHAVRGLPEPAGQFGLPLSRCLPLVARGPLRPELPAAHAARRGTLLLAGGPYRSCPRWWHVDLVDLAGAVARRTRTPLAESGAKELLTCGDLACLVGADDGIARVLDPATVAVTVLPHGLSEENKAGEGWGRRESFHVVAYAFGRVSSTGEYKLLRLVRLLRYTPGRGGGLMAEVLSLDGDARWRSRRSPPVLVAADRMDAMAVVNGIMYFLAVQIEQLPFVVNNSVSVQAGSIASFNLETEEWMPILRGSLNGRRRQGNAELMLQQEPPLLTLT
ncbi:hypothetical protein C2845_PM05G20330 [Panicum miliaceum]|uniref:Uncharacterized protein n=1 Tax=Panicum miliaceum TaxID=4540 RepID=A0A3L6ST21_PANMI|nr:hypothetical protein C2845_PM05G20330 [Panicum miliaceum]